MNGRCVGKYAVVGGMEHTIELRDWHDGLYFYNMLLDDAFIGNGKIVRIE